MKHTTHGLLEHFLHFDWFCACGTYQGEDFLRVKSKPAAINSLLSRKWSNFSVVLTNRFRKRILRGYGQNDAANAACDDVFRKATETMVMPLDIAIAKHLADDESMKARIHERIMSDLLDTLLETEFADDVPPLFYSPVLFPLYMGGHLPCGWSGASPAHDWNGSTLADLPPGKVMVY